MINKATLVGRLGKDAETKTLESGINVINFTLATSEKYKDKQGEWQEQTEWHNVSMFSKSINIAEYLLKGVLVYVEGKLKTRSWEKDGDKRYITEVVGRIGADGIIKFLEKVRSASEMPQPSDYEKNGSSEDLDDLPF